MESKIGNLYLVATPIGNIEDLSARGRRILTEVEHLFCEDTRRTSLLLKAISVHRREGPKSFHEHSSPKVLNQIAQLLQAGESVAYVSDAGMPVVSDPGFVLVRMAQQIGAVVRAIPGPSVPSMLFAVSGLGAPKYFFHGFFPRTRGEVEKTMNLLKTLPVVHIFFESPARILATLGILDRNLPKQQIVLGRELTKTYEELLRGLATELITKLKARPRVKGECSLAILGGDDLSIKNVVSQESATVPSDNNLSMLSIEQKDEIANLVRSGISSKDAAKELSRKFGVPRRVIYEFIIHHLT